MAIRSRLGRRPLSFSSVERGYVDDQTGSRWNVHGRATFGPLEGRQLTAYRHLDTFWFAWVTFHPETELLR